MVYDMLSSIDIIKTNIETDLRGQVIIALECAGRKFSRPMRPLEACGRIKQQIDS